jgi:NAD dependent epimerase/dehydratase family enzyme
LGKSAYQFSEISERGLSKNSNGFSKRRWKFCSIEKIDGFQLASPVGKGKQWMNWIHIEDLANMYVEAIENPQYNGSYNAVADETVTNETFMKSMAQKSNKFFLPIPVPAL